MPPVTRLQTCRTHGEEEALRKALKRPNHRSGPVGRQSQARATRATWENRLANFSTDTAYLAGQTFARTVDPFVDIQKLLKEEVRVERELVETSQTWRHMIALMLIDNKNDARAHRLDQQKLLAIKALLSPEDDMTSCTVAVRNHIGFLAWSRDLLTAQELVNPSLPVNSDVEAQEHRRTQVALLKAIDIPLGDTQLTVQPKSQPLSTVSWPAVLYQNMEFDVNRPEEGLLMNGLLVTVYKTVHRRAGDVNTNRVGLPVTASSIIYIATLVVAALASPEKYGHRKLFRLLSAYLEEHRHAHWYRDLLRWWARSHGSNAHIVRKLRASSFPSASITSSPSVVRILSLSRFSTREPLLPLHALSIIWCFYATSIVDTVVLIPYIPCPLLITWSFLLTSHPFTCMSVMRPLKIFHLTVPHIQTRVMQKNNAPLPHRWAVAPSLL
ncbi:hypothetical protein BKA70DRAFT_1223607 [Coprinopsis sp. MPI-PUGE-AT-0042]|nr:hypothetical protein BKA70DRAFT_1223607 [Coprinopsis sp. MPI-PUGE-AT-0042]